MATWKGPVSTNSHSKVSAFMGKFSLHFLHGEHAQFEILWWKLLNRFPGAEQLVLHVTQLNITAGISVTYRLAHWRSHCTMCTRRAGWYRDSTRGQQRSGFSTSIHKLCTWKLLFCCTSWQTAPLSSLIKERKQLKPIFRQGNTGTLFSASTLENTHSANLV